MEEIINKGILAHKVFKFQDGTLQDFDDQIAKEEPLEINLVYGSGNKRSRQNIAITMRTPGQDQALALGFLYTEGILNKPEDLLELEMVNNKLAQDSQNNIIELHIDPKINPDIGRLERHFYTSSSCGVCGKASIELVQQHISFLLTSGKPQLKANLIMELPSKLARTQALFSLTGGIHAAARFDINGLLKDYKEDVGRHNALDKLIGTAFKNKALPLDNQILLLSGRASFELIQKALMAGFPIVAAVGAPSSLAIELAQTHGMTLIGFLKEKSFNVYSGIERIIL